MSLRLTKIISKYVLLKLYLNIFSKGNWQIYKEKNIIEQVAEAYLASQKTVFAWGMGLTHHMNGTENVEAISNLALLRGMIGGEGKGLLPLRGHSNVQGVGSMGFTPALKDKMFQAIEQKYGINFSR